MDSRKTTIATKIQKLAPGTHVELYDTTGTQDHWDAVIVSEAFQGKSRVERQRMVMDLLKPEFASGEIHALSMKTFTGEEKK